MPPSVLACPYVGHKAFEKSLNIITVGDADTAQQVSKFVRPHSCVRDALGIEYAPGELQRADLTIARTLFAHRVFVLNTFERHRSHFHDSECRIYQFQTITPSEKAFVFGLFIADGDNHLIDYCVDTELAHKRKPILLRLICALCTPESVSRRFDH